MNPKDWLKLAALAGLGVATGGLSGLGGLFGTGAAEAAGAAGAAGAAEGAGMLGLEALPAATMPAMETMAPMTFPYGTMPAEPLQWGMADELAALRGGGAPFGGFDQYASAGDLRGMMQTAKQRLGPGLDALGDDRLHAALRMSQMGQKEPARMAAGGQRPTMPETRPTSRASAEDDRRRRGITFSGLFA